LEVFIYVANSIGLFIQLEDRIFIDPDKRMPRVLVELEVEDGLPAELDIHWEGGIHVQRLDFFKVPFCYHRCRKTRHLKRDCLGFASMYDSVSDEGDSTPYFS
jgi:hypothetical protein